MYYPPIPAWMQNPGTYLCLGAVVVFCLAMLIVEAAIRNRRDREMQELYERDQRKSND